MLLRDLPPDVIEFLDAPRCAVIATHGPDGVIWQAVVWYDLTGDEIPPWIRLVDREFGGEHLGSASGQDGGRD